jgi:phosphocarrier protein
MKAAAQEFSSTMSERELIIPNKLGLHARAAAKLVQTASRYQSKVELICKNREVNAKSILGVMMLAAGKGTPIKLRATGSDEGEALDALVNLIERKFDEGE